MAGHIERLPSGRWFVRVRSGYTREGKRRSLSRTVDTEQQAQAAAVEMAARLGRMPNAGDGMLLSEYFERYFVPERERYLTNATMAFYKRIYRLYIEPAFGCRQMHTIRHSEVQELVLGLTHSQAKQTVATLRAVLRSAWDDGILDEEPMRHRLRMPAPDRGQLPVWSAADVARALGAMEGSPMEALWLCMVGGGLRREEAYALYWGDLSFADVTAMDGAGACLCSAVVDDAYTAYDGRKAVKTAYSERTAVIAEPFSSRLRALSVGRGADEPLCRLTIGRLPKAWSVMWEEPKQRHKGSFKGRMLDAGVPYVPLSRMRATHETIMQAAGVGDSLNSRIHGRASNSQVGYRHYLNPGQDAMAPAAAAMGDAVRRAGNA